ncbi:hypothetical protein BDM02DRAFT_1413070 [Thelephora ganbajun]|uniref:Uncharacterized protein n=1 Tax=Thelephora ganbajun TaxID=370292 RepID=A0ACB6Z235_THEGA|nr:hypothetical protein BDM02DRAFT_1413070 [Thelephora ganbajun]
MSRAWPCSKKLPRVRSWTVMPFGVISSCIGCTSFCSCLREVLFVKQGDMHPLPEPHQPRPHESTPDPQVLVLLWDS